MRIKTHKKSSCLVAIFFILILLHPQQSEAQLPIYVQTFNTAYPNWPAGWSTLPASGGWVMDTSTANASNGYPGASGGAMVEIANPISGDTATYVLTSAGMSTIGFTNITVIYGARNTTHFSDSGSTISSFQWSSDKINWNNISYIENANNSKWDLINSGVPMALPAAAAGQDSIWFRWIAYLVPTPSGTYRIDDLNINGDTDIIENTVDTIKIMSYNVNDYGYYDSGNCPTQTPLVKNPYLRTILQYVNPDIVGLEKMQASNEAFYTDTLISDELDSVCNGCYGHSAYTNESGYYKENMLYYKTSKFGFISTTVIYSGDPNISDIDLHKLYYKSSALAANHDTVFLNIILIHDESGSGDSLERATEIGGAMSWLDAHVTKPGNYFIMGDFNVQGATEACYQDMLAPSNTNIKFYDPVNEIGNWSRHSSAYANYLTQSTRVTDPGDCGATGGMNNRYDQILCTEPVISGSDSIQYMEDSYTVIGQDGNHVNKAIIDAPTNTSVPSNVLTALYQMSEHLPVILKLTINSSNTSAGIKGVTFYPTLAVKYNSILTDNLTVQLSSDLKNTRWIGTFNIYDLQGRLVQTTFFDPSNSNKYLLSYLTQGMYIFSIIENNQSVFNGKFIKL